MLVREVEGESSRDPSVRAEAVQAKKRVESNILREGCRRRTVDVWSCSRSVMWKYAK